MKERDIDNAFQLMTEALRPFAEFGEKLDLTNTVLEHKKDEHPLVYSPDKSFALTIKDFRNAKSVLDHVTGKRRRKRRTKR